MAEKHADTNARIHALWTLNGLGALPKELVIASLADSRPRIRRAAVQLSETLLAARDTDVTAALAPLANDADAQVLAQLFHAYRRANLPVPSAITAQNKRPLLAAVFERDKALTGKVIALSDSAKEGREIYQTLCTACHGPDGQGMKVDGKPLAPNLTKSQWLARPGNGGALARILLHGLTGPIDGVTYGEGIMPPLAEVYDDEQIASVLNYVGETWHGWKQPVAREVVASIRAINPARKTPWTIEDLQLWMQGK
jgi:mono/diheme cytochrome c family protein